MKFIKYSILYILCLSLLLTTFSQTASAAEEENEQLREFDKKTISILGDSISTYANASSGLAADTSNTTIENNRVYYTDGRTDVTLNDTWWIKASKALGAEILVNNSYSGTTIFSPFSDNDELGYLTRPYNLHDNTGENAGQEPDIIAVYMGTNDISYHKSRLGSFDDINFNTLIRNVKGNTVYAKPYTACEAYAIMLHKIQNTYKNAEIYCFTSLPRVQKNNNDNAITESFNNSIVKIAEHFNCLIVDLYNDSGFSEDSRVLNRYYSDGYIHPNKKGMDAISNAFLSSVYQNSRYMNGSDVYNISYDLKDVIVNEGLLKNTKYGSEFKCTFSQLKYGNYNITVTMGETDITESVVSDNKIFIPEVTDNVSITATVTDVNRQFHNYRFEKNGDILINIAQNENHTNNLSHNENGDITMQTPAILYYDKPWTVVFDTIDNLRNKTIILGTNEEKGYSVILDCENDILGLNNNNSPDKIYGIDLEACNIDTSVSHTYKITNSYGITGINTFTVYVDSKEIGKFDSYFVDSVIKEKDISQIYECNFKFDVIKKVDSNNINYIQLWETDSLINHSHTFKHPETTSPTCDEYGSTITTCDCGTKRVLHNIEPNGHTEGNWIISKKPSSVEAGEAYKKCTVCGEITQTKAIPQLKCEKPVINSVTNTSDGVKVTWNAVTGADSYRVYRHLKGGKWVYLCTTTERAYIDTDVKNGYWYYYTVRAVNEAGYSDFYTTGNTIQYLLSPVFTKRLNTQNGVYLSWNKIYGAQGYYLYKKTGNGNWQYYCRVNSTSFTDKNVKNGIIYSYRIKAVRNKTVSGFYLNGATITRLTAPVLKAPLNTDSGIKIQWNKMAGAAGYFVYKKAGNYWHYIGKTSANAFTDTTAKPGSVNIYTVKAYDSNGNHSIYNTKGVTTKRLLTPHIAGATSVKSGIQLRWNDVAGAQGYYIYRKTGTGAWKYIGKTTSETYIDKSSVKGTTYTYTVKAYSGSYVSTYNAKGITAKR